MCKCKGEKVTYDDLRLELVLELGLFERHLPSEDDDCVEHKDVSLLLCLDGELGLRDKETALEEELSHRELVLLVREGGEGGRGGREGREGGREGGREEGRGGREEGRGGRGGRERREGGREGGRGGRE